MQPKFKIGQQFHTSRGKGASPIVHTITDFHRTYNSAGMAVRLRYVATHEFAGQTIEDCNITENSVAMGIARMEGKL